MYINDCSADIFDSPQESIFHEKKVSWQQNMERDEDLIPTDDVSHNYKEDVCYFESNIYNGLAVGNHHTAYLDGQTQSSYSEEQTQAPAAQILQEPVVPLQDINEGPQNKPKRSRKKKTFGSELERIKSIQKQKETKNVLTNLRNIIRANHKSMKNLLPKKDNLSIQTLKRVIKVSRNQNMVLSYVNSKHLIQDIFSSRIEDKQCQIRYIPGVARLILNPDQVQNIK